MIPDVVVVAVFIAFVCGTMVGAVTNMAADGTVKRWLELRHDFRMKALEQRARWLDERKP